jgi:hypothetical protein
VKSTKRTTLGVTAVLLAAGFVVGPAASASASTSYQLTGTVQKGGNTYFSVGRNHSSGVIRVNLKSWTPCGNHVLMSLRKGVSETSTRVTGVLEIKKRNTVYTFKKYNSNSTTIPSGKYYITAASPSQGCPQYPDITFKGSINM